jgi:Papain family cysteine protease
MMRALKGTPGQNLSEAKEAHVFRRILVFCLVSVGCAVAQGPNAIPAVVFGPQAVAEPSGSPTPVQFQIALAPLVHGPYSLVVLNPAGATGTISLNGTTVFQTLRGLVLTETVTLGTANTLTVELNRGNGATVWVGISGWEYALASEYPSDGTTSSVVTPLAVTPKIYPSGSVDWITKGAVTGVKNQGALCPASWAFSATGAIEGLVFLRTGNLASLSEQEMLDCSAALSCLVGSVPQALNWAISNGDATEAAYPYTGRKGKCKASSVTPSPGSQITGMKRGPIGNENALGASVDEAPVSAVINGNWFSSYTGGVANPNCESQIPSYYGVLVVGYGTDGVQPYWLVKTSLGTSWGEQGYFRIVRNQNACGIADYTLLPEN